ncbi:hypothetical protein WR25_26616 [Diploscapter pachys]|uniref:Uncharacterized protein n=1 Tax=Diploscapter pachys TaxID=2018661 RepID=A0A2A2LCB2_9BILA|nr:hypothetical protein WR25_26616 [Diploscapter pachys]
MLRQKRSGRSPASNSNQDRVRTHLLFASKPERQNQKRKRRAQNKLHSVFHKKDEMVQVGNAANELDPMKWTGNQRVLHFGPMAQRDPYFYYYPKGWDILYPGEFGFFPYRTTKFRGSSTAICCSAFGAFFIIGGAFMCYMGFWVLYQTPFWHWPPEQRIRPPPIQIAGPIMFCLGVLLFVIPLLYSILTSDFFDLNLHHTQKHYDPARLTAITTTYVTPPPIFEKEPYQPLPPPAYPVLENKYAHTSVVKPHDEMKLYPPVIPGYSTLSLHKRSPSDIFIASPYNTLRATNVGRYHSGLISATAVLENRNTTTGSIGGNRRSVDSDSARSSQKRSRSMGPLMNRAGSRASRSSAKQRKELSQL